MPSPAAAASTSLSARQHKIRRRYRAQPRRIAAVAWSIGKKLSTRSYCSVMSCAVPSVAMAVNNLALGLLAAFAGIWIATTKARRQVGAMT